MADNRRGARGSGAAALDVNPEAAEGAAEEPLPTYYVQAHPDQGDRVALWDQDKAHPTGEVFVAAPSGPVEVAETPAVLQALRDGRIVKVGTRQAEAWHRDRDEEREEARSRMTGLRAMTLQAGMPLMNAGDERLRELEARLQASEDRESQMRELEARLQETEARLTALTERQATATPVTTQAESPPKGE